MYEHVHIQQSKKLCKGGKETEMKPRKLRSPIKAIHEALVRLAVGNPLCLQPAKTESFRDLITSFNSLYYIPPVSSSSPSSDTYSHGNLCHHLQQSLVDIHVISRGEKEEAVSISAATASTSTCSSCFSSSSVTAGPGDPEDLPKGAINSRRFFFSPCTSKLITGESFLEVGLTEVEPLVGDPIQEPEEAEEEDEEEDGKFDTSSETSDIKTILEGMAMTEETSALCKQSIPMALASRNPYRDFRNSMDEMVAAHDLRDWSGLENLLRCYLRLNEQKTHKFIVLAFTDLLMHLVSQGKIHKSVMHDTFSTSPFPSPNPAPHHHPCLSD